MENTVRNWIEFDGTPAQATNRLYVSLNIHGEIVFNRRTYEELARPEAVVLLYDPETKTIGVRPSSPLMPHSFALKKKGNCAHEVIRAQPFLREHNIVIEKTVRFGTARIEDGILILELRKLINVSRGPKKVVRRH